VPCRNAWESAFFLDSRQGGTLPRSPSLRRTRCDGRCPSQSGTALNVTVGSLPGVILQGSATSIGFQVFGTFLDSGCTVALVLVAQNDGTVTLSASTGVDIDCGFTSCDSIWVGTLSR